MIRREAPGHFDLFSFFIFIVAIPRNDNNTNRNDNHNSNNRDNGNSSAYGNNGGLTAYGLNLALLVGLWGFGAQSLGLQKT